MKRFAKHLTVFIIGFGILIIIPFVIISNQDNYDRYTSSNENIITLQTKSQCDSLDVLFVGSSYGYSSINPILLDSAGIKSFNLGIATAGVEFMELIITDYLNNVKKYPHKVFILISPMTFSTKSDNFELYPINRYLENPVSNFEIALKYNRWGDLLPLYRKSFAKGYTNIISGQRLVKHRRTVSINKGFVKSDVIFSKEIQKEDEHYYLKLKNDQFNKSAYLDLIRIINNLKDKGIEVTLLEIPTNKLRDYFSVSFLKDYENFLVDIGKNIPIRRLAANNFKSTDYRNIDHMNTSGATKATREIITFIKNTSTK